MNHNDWIEKYKKLAANRTEERTQRGYIVDWAGEWPLGTPQEPEQPQKCPKCNQATLNLMHDQHGMYFKCPHCNWDTAGLYKTKDKYGKA